MKSSNHTRKHVQNQGHRQLPPFANHIRHNAGHNVSQTRSGLELAILEGNKTIKEQMEQATSMLNKAILEYNNSKSSIEQKIYTIAQKRGQMLVQKHAKEKHFREKVEQLQKQLQNIEYDRRLEQKERNNILDTLHQKNRQIADLINEKKQLQRKVQSLQQQLKALDSNKHTSGETDNENTKAGDNGNTNVNENTNVSLLSNYHFQRYNNT